MGRKTIALGLLAAVALLGACGKTKQTRSEGPSLAIASPASGASAPGNVVELDMSVSGIQIVAPDGDTSGATGHFHVFIDRDPVAAGEIIPREPGIVHSAADPIRLTGLSVGEHTFTVVLGDGAHARLGDVAATTTVMVEGPSVDASAPATVAAGDPVELTIAVGGVTLAAADGDTSGETGHLHLFIDQDPILDSPVPTGVDGIIHTTETTYQVTGLEAGDHTIWVVVGDGTHTPFDPPTMDMVTVTVS